MDTETIDRLCNSLSEIMQKLGEELKTIATEFNDLFESLSDYEKKSYKLSNKHFKPYSSRYFRPSLTNLYIVRKRPKRHLPYQRRNY